MNRPSVLVVDDRELDRKLLDRLLTMAEYEVTTAASGEEALELVRSRLFDAAVVDLRMPGMDGLELLRRIKRHDPAIEVVVMTADPTVPTAVEALKEGAFDCIAKPLNRDELYHLMDRLMERSLLRREVKALRTRLGEELTVRDLIGVAPAMAELQKTIAKVAPSDSPVLIEGESGTGKELVAAAIHRLSARSKGPFVPVNCSAIARDLMESEFFGHVRGAFSGAVADAQGLFRSADGGTIFLDEVAELPPALQAKLLRVLQENEVRPVGSTKSQPVDVRVVAATNRRLDEAIREGSLRQDFFYRLNVVHLVIPPLRERKEDLPALTAPSEEVSETCEAAPPRIGGKAILVVDDEPDVASVLADMLALDGHQVATAANGVEALEKLNAGTYDLILSDIKMPGLDGPGLYHKIEQRHPELLGRFIFLTGDMLTPETTAFLVHTAARSINKPFVPRDVQQVVQKVLQRTGGTPV